VGVATAAPTASTIHAIEPFITVQTNLSYYHARKKIVHHVLILSKKTGSISLLNNTQARVFGKSGKIYQAMPEGHAARGIVLSSLSGKQV
jgi:hypothetical protein